MELVEGRLRVGLSREERLAAENTGAHIYRLLKAIGDEVGHEIMFLWPDRGLVHKAVEEQTHCHIALWFGNEGHGFDCPVEALEWVLKQDAWSGWRQRTAAEDGDYFARGPARPPAEHAECLACDAYILIHRGGDTHCDCGGEWPCLEAQP